MADAGLTNGAFYAHFESKDDLVATAVAEQLRLQASSLAPHRRAAPASSRWCATTCPRHRDNPVDGCPSAALLDEIGRCGEATSSAYTDGMLGIADDSRPDRAARSALGARQALAVRGADRHPADVAGADRPELSDAVLEQGVQNALGLLGTATRPPDPWCCGQDRSSPGWARAHRRAWRELPAARSCRCFGSGRGP